MTTESPHIPANILRELAAQEGFDLVYAGPETFIRKSVRGDAVGKWFPTFTEARKAAIEWLRVPRDSYNKAIEKFKKMVKEEAEPSLTEVRK